MVSDSVYKISPKDWPATSTKDDVSIEEAEQVFDLFPDFYPRAIERLADTNIVLD